MSNVEQQFISKLIETGDYKSVSENQINSRFLQGSNKRAFKYIQNFMLKYGKVPSLEAFGKKFPDYEITSTEEGMEFYCDELRNKARHNEIVDALEVSSGLIGELESEKAYQSLLALINRMENNFTKSDRVEINKDAQNRLEEYKKRAKSGGVTGLSTGIDRLDQIISGFNDEELIILIAFTGSGKRFSYKRVA